MEDNIPQRYLNFLTIITLARPTKSATHSVCVRCFQSTDYWECPNPNNTELVAISERAYKQKFFFRIVELYLTTDAFKNPCNWEHPPTIPWK